MNQYLSVAQEMFQQICEIHPAFKTHYSEHLRDYDELLPHLFMGDISRLVEQFILLDDRHDDVRRCCDILEQFFKDSDADIRNLISVSFLEMLAYEEEVLPCLRSFLSPEMAKDLQYYTQML